MDRPPKARHAQTGPESPRQAQRANFIVLEPVIDVENLCLLNVSAAFNVFHPVIDVQNQFL